MKPLDLLFPPNLYCAACGNLIDRSRPYSLCDNCRDHFRWKLSPVTERNGIRVLACVEYGLYERSLIFALKYAKDRYCAGIIADIMRDRLRQAGVEADLIVPVPLYRKKERQRGFNQTALIARELARRLGVSCWTRALLRVRETRPMRGLGPSERRENVAGSIELAPGYEGKAAGKQVLLIDDFYTPGSTAESCCEALREMKPAGLTVLVYAVRTPQEEILAERQASLRIGRSINE